MRKSSGALIAALALATLWAPRALAGQATVAVAKTAAAAPAVDAQLTAFAKLQLALNAARDEYNVALSKAHEPAAKDEAMDEFAKKRAEILTAMGSSEDAYSKELFRVSSDVARREAFDRLMKELAAK